MEISHPFSQFLLRKGIQSWLSLATQLLQSKECGFPQGGRGPGPPRFRGKQKPCGVGPGKVTDCKERAHPEKLCGCEGELPQDSRATSSVNLPSGGQLQGTGQPPGGTPGCLPSGAPKGRAAPAGIQVTAVSLLGPERSSRPSALLPYVRKLL